MTRTLVFVKGLVAGSLGTLIAASATLYLLNRMQLIHFAATAHANPGDWLHWAYLNLGSSIPVFALLHFGTLR